MLDFFKVLRKNRKDNKEKSVKQAIYGDSSRPKCQVSSSRATNYFKSTSDSTPSLYSTTDDVTPTWTVNDVNTALSNCSNSSAPGLDKISFETLKSTDPNVLAEIFNEVCTSATPKPGWTKACYIQR